MVCAGAGSGGHDGARDSGAGARNSVARGSGARGSARAVCSEERLGRIGVRRPSGSMRGSTRSIGSPLGGVAAKASRAVFAPCAVASPRFSASAITSRKPFRPSSATRRLGARMRSAAGAATAAEEGKARAEAEGGDGGDGAGAGGGGGGGAGCRCDPGCSTASRSRIESAPDDTAGFGAGSVRARRADSPSTLRIASSSARRSRVISASVSGGSLIPRNCATSAVRARS